VGDEKRQAVLVGAAVTRFDGDNGVINPVLDVDDGAERGTRSEVASSRGHGDLLKEKAGRERDSLTG
jgi:hypothetical protein